MAKERGIRISLSQESWETIIKALLLYGRAKKLTDYIESKLKKSLTY
jgi:hypothetical protein